jgi:hypothetical protein
MVDRISLHLVDTPRISERVTAIRVAIMQPLPALVIPLCNGREREANISRIVKTGAAASFAWAAPNGGEALWAGTALFAGFRIVLTVVLAEKVAERGYGGCDAANACFDVGAEDDVCDPDCWGLLVTAYPWYLGRGDTYMANSDSPWTCSRMVYGPWL